MSDDKTENMIQQAYNRSMKCDPVTIKNIWFVIRNPIFTLRMLWFSASILGKLQIDKEHLDKIFKRRT
jgi:hypothetical protein